MKPKAKLVLFAILFASLLLASTINLIHAQDTTPQDTSTPQPIDVPAEASTAQEIFSMHIPNYALNTPVRLNILYFYTQNYSLNVHSLEQTSHEETHSENPPQASVTFSSDASDVYDLHLQVRYDVWVNQTVRITLYEKNETGKIIEFDIYSKGFNLDMSFTTSEPVTYPSTEDIVNAWWIRGQNMFSQFSMDQQQTLDKMTSANVVAVTAGVIAIGVVALILIVVIAVVRRLGRLEGAYRRSL